MRRLYTKQHRFYCGIDLHARLLAICIVDHDTASVVCGNVQTANATVYIIDGVLLPPSS